MIRGQSGDVHVSFSNVYSLTKSFKLRVSTLCLTMTLVSESSPSENDGSASFLYVLEFSNITTSFHWN